MYNDQINNVNLIALIKLLNVNTNNRGDYLKRNHSISKIKKIFITMFTKSVKQLNKYHQAVKKASFMVISQNKGEFSYA